MRRSLLILVAMLVVGSYGCTGMKATPVERGFGQDKKMVEDSDLGKVYLAPGFDFKGYDALLVSDVSAKAVLGKKEIDPDEMAIFFKNALIKKLSETGIFQVVTDDKSALSSREGATPKILILESAFSELDPGSAALRYFVGMGAGRSIVQVESEIKDAQTGSLRFQSSNRHLGIMGTFGGDSKAFILNSLNEIAGAHGAFVKRIASGGKVEPYPQKSPE